MALILQSQFQEMSLLIIHMATISEYLICGIFII